MSQSHYRCSVCGGIARNPSGIHLRCWPLRLSPDTPVLADLRAWRQAESRRLGLKVEPEPIVRPEPIPGQPWCVLHKTTDCRCLRVAAMTPQEREQAQRDLFQSTRVEAA